MIKHIAAMCVLTLFLPLSSTTATIPSQYVNQTDEWFRSDEGRRITNNIITYQTPHGSWPKNRDTASQPFDGDTADLEGTFDNGATTGELRFLARAFNATNEPRVNRAFLKGLDNILEAQYPAGGWPMFYPTRSGYYQHITFNDNSMVRILEFLRDITESSDYAFLDTYRRTTVKTAMDKGIQCILDCQIIVNGKRTVWCAQHDEVDLRPRPARSYELESLSGGESVGILRFLMSLDNPGPEIQRAIRAGVAWYESAKITGIRVDELVNGDRIVFDDPNASPVWARFYEIETNRPFFCDRDGIKKYQLSEVGIERRSGYRWYGDWGAELLAEDYPRWTARYGITDRAAAQGGALAGDRYRVVVSTDIGGTDPDDFQSMIHLLLYADVFDIEGLISSPYGPGRKQDILKVIDCYANDYANLKTHSDKYPTPDALRAITKLGETERPPYVGVRQSTEGSEWIVQCARRDDPRPLYVLVWGGIEDLAQALHDAPDILPKLRVYWIGGPNKKWSPDAYQYIVTHYPELWIIESNATYRGWFVGGNQSGQWGNKEFVTQHIAGNGALGDFFNQHLGGIIKMGDTPSVSWLLKGTPEDPSQPGWGGRFVRAWERPHATFDRLPTQKERIEIFSILELALPIGENAPDRPEAQLVVENQELDGFVPGDGTIRFRFCPKAAKKYDFTIRGNIPALEGAEGGITSYLPAPEIAQYPSAKHPNWWTDNPSIEFAEGEHHGAMTVSRWRVEFLKDFATRIDRCKKPVSP